MNASRPLLRISEPCAAASITADPACARDIAAANHLHRRIAIRRAATAARLVTEMFPSAERLTLDREVDGDGRWFIPVSIRDAAGRLLWFNTDHFGDDEPPPVALDHDDAAVPAPAEDLAGIEEPTLEAICLLIDAAASWDPGVLDQTDGRAPDDQLSDVDLRVLHLIGIREAFARLHETAHTDGSDLPQPGLTSR